ncbi:MAG: hypothetical protein DELT_01400 [Desulfovibrio sp.]
MKPFPTFVPPGSGFAWAVLLALTLVVFAVCEAVHLPASPLLAGIAGGAFLALRDAGLRMPKPFFQLCQSILGLMISTSFTVDVLYGMRDNWFLTILIVVSVIIFGLIGGLALTVRQWLPGTTGIWGISPGGATAMILMSEANGGDMRLVAIMQYLRVVIVSFIAVGVARFLGADLPAEAKTFTLTTFFPPTDYLNLALTLAVAVACCFTAYLFRSSIAGFLLAMLVGAVVQNAGIVTIELPGWLLTIAFMTIGWNIGLSFNRAVFLYACKAMPKILAAIFFMVGSAGVLAAALVVVWDIDPLTAYLATSPGGADAVAIIAASSGGDMAFIMGTQTLRLFVVVLTGPYLARAAARLVRHRLPPR